MSRSYRSLGRSLHMDQCRRAGEWARRYASLGWNPLPSRADDKRPALGGYQRYFDDPIPRSWLDDWRWPNVQLVMGARWNLCAIDIDGQSGLEAWIKMIPSRQDSQALSMAFVSGAPEMSCWGKHFVSRRLYFGWPPAHPGTNAVLHLPTTILWTSKDHQEVRFLGDRSLAVVPPSVHPERRTPFEWLRFSEMCPPPVLPEWIALKVLSMRPAPASPPPPRLEPLRRRPRPVPSFRSDEVLAALAGRHVEIAVRYGLRTVGNRHPFLKCHAIDRPDRRPSCTIDRRTGWFFDWGANESFSFFELLSRLAPAEFPTWEDARDTLGAAYLGRLYRRDQAPR